MSRIGLIFGSFNPPHRGHEYLAHFALASGNLDEIWYVLQTTNPFKATASILDAQHRLEMLRILADNRRDIKVHVSSARNIPATLKALEKTFNHEFSLVMGSDLMSSFKDWHDYSALNKYKVFTTKRAMPFSSQEIRARVRNHQSISDLVTNGIEHYILQNKLYLQ